MQRGLVIALAGTFLLSFLFVRNFHTQEIAAAPLGTAAMQESATTTARVGLDSRYHWYPVARVIDGDTIVVDIDGKDTKVRLIGLDTPETVDPRKVVQCFGREASDEAKKILTGQQVRLETDPSQGTPCFAKASQGTCDKYGRLLAYVFLPDLPAGKAGGTSFNEFMTAEGYGHEYTYDLPYKYQKEFKAAEKTAREEKKGLWADDACAGNTSAPAK